IRRAQERRRPAARHRTPGAGAPSPRRLSKKARFSWTPHRNLRRRPSVCAQRRISPKGRWRLRKMPKWPVHARIDGPIVLIGFGSIGKGTLPLIERHFKFDKKRLVVIDPDDKDRKLLDDRGIRFIHQAVTKDNYRHLLTPLLTDSGGQGFCVNVSVDTSSLDIMTL